MNRIEERLAALKEEGKKAFITYTTAGLPDYDTTKKIMFAQEKAGIDIMEIGVPFSDPIADGPVIQDASFKAIQNGASLEGTFTMMGEVRKAGLELGIPENLVFRQPFPGPGLGVRCLGAITRERLEAVREADAILREEFKIAGLDKKVWQYFTVVPDFKSVGVRDNARCFEYPVIIRAVNTIDAMSASIEQIDWPVLLKITDRILKEVKNVNRVCYDLSPKPTATIEWE